MPVRPVHRTEIQVRFSDTDALGHVNHVAFAAYLETARVEALALLDALGTQLSTVVAHLEIDYRHEIRLGERVAVEMWVSRIGRSSWTYQYRVLAGDTLAAEAETVQVVVNPLLMRPESIPEDVRGWLTGHLIEAGVPGD